MTDKPVLTVQELAKLVSVCPRSITNWIARGQLKARKLGRRTVILREDAVEWLNSAPRAAVKEGSN